MGEKTPQLNPDGISVKGCQYIYAPKGQAGEYAPLACNPYRGCGHGCAYCLHPDTLVQKADGSTARIADILIGDEIIGVVAREEKRRAWNWTFAPAKVLNKIDTLKVAIRITLDDGRTVICSGDHRWLTERGWKFTRNLTTNNSIRQLTRFTTKTPAETDDYRRGYLAGMIRGDATLKRYDYSGRFTREGRSSPQKTDFQHHFRLALADAEALDRSASYLLHFGVETHRVVFAEAVGARAHMDAIRTHSAYSFNRISKIVAYERQCSEWFRGWLAGIFDAEGGTTAQTVRVHNIDETILATTEAALAQFGFRHIRDVVRNNGCTSVRILGGISEVVRFFNLTAPSIHRKFPVIGQSLKGASKIVSVETLGETVPMVDITTSTENFIANGLVSHNCYVPLVTKQPRPEFDAGAKERPNFLDHLKRDAEKYAELGITEQVMLSFTTDPYHPGDTTLTRRVLAVLAIQGLGFCTLTKGGTRALRDLLLFRPDRDSFASTLTSLDAHFSKKWERNAAPPADRIAALRKFHEAGIFTWVSLEPTLDVNASAAIVEATHGFVDLYKVGRVNYLPMTKTTDWRDYTIRMLDVLNRVGAKHYIKHDLQPFLPDGYPNMLRQQQHH